MKSFVRGAAPPVSLRGNRGPPASCSLYPTVLITTLLSLLPKLATAQCLPWQVSRSQLPAITGQETRPGAQSPVPIWRIRIVCPRELRDGADWLQKGMQKGLTSNRGPRSEVIKGIWPRSQPDPGQKSPRLRHLRSFFRHLLQGLSSTSLASRRINKGLNRAASPPAMASFKRLLSKPQSPKSMACQGFVGS